MWSGLVRLMARFRSQNVPFEAATTHESDAKVLAPRLPGMTVGREARACVH